MNVRKILFVLLLSEAVLITSALGAYEVNWHTIDGGGGVSSGGETYYAYVRCMRPDP